MKTQKAVIIDGMNGDWAEAGNYYFDNQPDPAGLAIYNGYVTRVYHVNSAAELSIALDQAKAELGGNLDLVAFIGHGTSKNITLGPSYDFSATKVEISAIERNITATGDIFLSGCKTALDTPKRASITRYVSSILPNHLVTGFSENMFPDLTGSWFDGLKFRIRSWSEFGWYDITKHYLNGNDITGKI